MFLVFDCETSGFVNERAPLNDPRQPHLIQLAAQLCEDDGEPVSGFSLIVNPNHHANCMQIPEAASSVHGITTERAAEVGLELGVVLNVFADFYQRADLLVAHNIKFDRAVMEIAIARKWTLRALNKVPLFCTMEAATPILNLPPSERMLKAGFNKPKPPKLAECVKHFFGEDLADAHDGWADMAACRRVYLHLKSISQTT